MHNNQSYPWTAEAHQTFKLFLTLLFVIAIVYAFFYNTWLELALIGLPALIVPLLFIKWMPKSFWSRHAVAVSAMIFSALHIHQMQGLIEIHFGIFTYLAALVFYRDWKVIVSAVLVVLIYHVAFFILQLQAVPVYIFESGHLEFKYLVLHAFYAILEGAMLIYVSRRMHLMGIAGAELEHNIQQKMQSENSVKLGLMAETFGNIKVLEQYNQLFKYIENLTSHAKNSVSLLDKQTAELQHNFYEITQLKDIEREHTNSIAASTEQMSKAISEVADQANHANNGASIALEEVENTNEATQQSQLKIHEFESTINHTSQEISSLSESCNEVSSVVDSIQAIAEQTNLLALNAAIESARAGEHGRGFAVVADEVRQLSFRTKESTTKITDILKALLEKSNNSVLSMQSSLTQLDQMLEHSKQMQNSISTVTDSVKQVSESIALVATATEKQASTSHTIAMNASEVKKLTEQEREYLNQISQSTLSVNQLTDKLRTELLKFE